MRKRVFSLLSLLIFALAPVYPEVRVLLQTRGLDSDPRLAGIVERTVAIELERVGLTPLQNEQPAGDTQLLFKRASELDAAFLMIVKGELANSALKVQMNLFRIRGRTELGERTGSFPLGIELDRHILDTVHSLVQEEGVRAEIEAAVEHDLSQSERGKKEAETAPVPTVASEQTESVRGFEFGAGAAPVILVGRSSDYFRYGVAVDFSALYGFRLFGVPAAVGADVTGSRIFPASGLPRGTVYTIGGGPSLQLATSPLQDQRIALRVTTGAAALTARLPDGPLLAKTVMFSRADVRAELRIAPRISVGALVGFLVVFEKDYPVMGVVPGIVVSLLQ